MHILLKSIFLLQRYEISLFYAELRKQSIYVFTAYFAITYFSFDPLSQGNRFH